jgi:hypothetical protein
MGWYEGFQGHILVLVGAAYHLLTGDTRHLDLAYDIIGGSRTRYDLYHVRIRSSTI